MLRRFLKWFAITWVSCGLLTWGYVLSQEARHHWDEYRTAPAFAAAAAGWLAADLLGWPLVAYVKLAESTGRLGRQRENPRPD